jgi:hypothetical protein
MLPRPSRPRPECGRQPGGAPRAAPAGPAAVRTATIRPPRDLCTLPPDVSRIDGRADRGTPPGVENTSARSAARRERLRRCPALREYDGRLHAREVLVEGKPATRHTVLRRRAPGSARPHCRSASWQRSPERRGGARARDSSSESATPGASSSCEAVVGNCPPPRGFRRPRPGQHDVPSDRSRREEADGAA